MTKERSGLIRLSMAFVEESDIGVYGLRVFNEHGKAYFLFVYYCYSGFCLLEYCTYENSRAQFFS